MKSFFKFIVVLFVFIYVWQLFTGPELHVVIDNQNAYSESIWFQALLVPVVVFVAIAVLFVLFSVFGAVLVSVAIAGAAVLFVGLSIFWPTLFAVLVCYWLFSDRKQNQVNDY